MAQQLTTASNIKEKSYYSMLQSVVTYIKDSGLKVGDKLPSETVLADTLYINRSTLREVLRVLEAFGVIDSRRGSGNIYVCDLEVGMMTVTMLSNILLDDKEGLTTLRAVIEANAISEFIRNATGYDFFMLERIYKEQLQSVKDARCQEYLENHIKFHDQLLKYSVSETAKRIVHSSLRLLDNDRVARFREGLKLDLQEEEYFHRAKKCSHEQILNAVLNKNIEEARMLIIQHIMIPGEITETM